MNSSQSGRTNGYKMDIRTLKNFLDNCTDTNIKML